MVQENTIPDENFMKKDDFTFETPLIDEDNMELFAGTQRNIFTTLSGGDGR